VPSRQRTISSRRGTAGPLRRIVLMRTSVPALVLALAAAAAACGGGDAAAPAFGDAFDDASTSDPSGDASFTHCGTSPATGTIPSSVEAVLSAKCQTCHGVTPTNDAPISLANYADVHVPFGPVPTYQVMYLLIQPGADPHMPFGDAPQLTSGEFATLSNWLTDCAPSGN
jgi:uncharacterized membrane protein